MIHTNLLLVGIKSHSLANQVTAFPAPHIEWHFKAYNKNALVQLLCPLSEWVLTLKLHVSRTVIKRRFICTRTENALLMIGTPGIVRVCQQSVSGQCVRSSRGATDLIEAPMFLRIVVRRIIKAAQ